MDGEGVTFSMRERRCFMTRLNMSDDTSSATDKRLTTSGMML